MELLSEEDKQAVSEAVRQAEAGTSGEIVFALTDASGKYIDASFRGAVLFMAAAAAVYLALPVNHFIPALLWTETIAFAASFAVITYLPWRRWFIPKHELEARVQEAALMEFYTSGLYRTRDSNGVLIYLSLLERRVVVLGDRAIHEKMGSRWDEVRDAIIQGIRRRQARVGICAAVGICGRSLAEHFPRKADDTNELSNDVIDRRPGHQ
jgi:putative membrane protein